MSAQPRTAAAGVRRSPSSSEAQQDHDPGASGRLIFDGDTLAVGGFVGIAVPEELVDRARRALREAGGPRDLTLVFAAGQGDGGARGLNHLAREGLIRRAIGAHWGLVPALGALALDGRIEAYCLPAGRDVPSLPRDRRRPAGTDHTGSGSAHSSIRAWRAVA